MDISSFNLDDQRLLDRASTIISAKYPTGETMTPNITKEYFMMKLGRYDREVFAMISLNPDYKITDYKELFFGTIDEAPIFIREVAKHALLTNAAMVVISHNHPNLDTHPSMADKRLTSILKEALAMFQIKLLDHVIVGGTEPFSFDEHALITGNYPQAPKSINPFDDILSQLEHLRYN